MRSHDAHRQAMGSIDTSVLKSAHVGADRSVKAGVVHPCELSDAICKNRDMCVEVVAKVGGAVPFVCGCVGNM